MNRGASFPQETVLTWRSPPPCPHHPQAHCQSMVRGTPPHLLAKDTRQSELTICRACVFLRP